MKKNHQASMNNNLDNCYWCNEKATTREHVPPRCLFPKKKDINFIDNNDYRQSLITVPSCDKHNTEKSHDDEYLMVCLGSKVGNNDIAFIHTNTKIRRALERKPHFFKSAIDDVLHAGDREFPVQLVYADNARLMHSFEAITRALIFHEFNFRYEGNCSIVSRMFVNPSDRDSTSYLLKSCQALDRERIRWRTQINGESPKIFTYQFSDMDGLGSFVLALTFYEKTIVYSVMSLLGEKNREKARILLQPEIDRFLDGDANN